MDDDIPYLLLTPGPLTTTRTVRESMLTDYCTWDDEYNDIVTSIRQDLVQLAAENPTDFTTVLMQGSGTFSVEATLGSVIPPQGKLLVMNNGAYGARISKIARVLNVDLVEIEQPEVERADLGRLADLLTAQPDITHVAMVHCETTTGMLNPVAEAGKLIAEINQSRGAENRVKFIVDAMSSFGGLTMSMESLSADYLISSANKCIQGVPGFGFVIARRTDLEATQGYARSLSLDLFDQWREMENKGGKWRYTSPTHVVRAFRQALTELEEEGGVAARERRYTENQQRLVTGLESAGYRTLLPAEYQSPIITAFHYPEADWFTFKSFYEALKKRRYVIYPGKVSSAETFRIGNIGNVQPEDIDDLVASIVKVTEELQPSASAQ